MEGSALLCRNAKRGKLLKAFHVVEVTIQHYFVIVKLFDRVSRIWHESKTLPCWERFLFLLHWIWINSQDSFFTMFADCDFDLLSDEFADGLGIGGGFE